MDLSCDYLKMKHPIAQKALHMRCWKSRIRTFVWIRYIRETTL